MAESGSPDMGTFLCLGFGLWKEPLKLTECSSVLVSTCEFDQSTKWNKALKNIFEMTWGNVVSYSDNYDCINLSQRGKHLHMLIKSPSDADK